jgi:hypothetical protein
VDLGRADFAVSTVFLGAIVALVVAGLFVVFGDGVVEYLFVV